MLKSALSTSSLEKDVNQTFPTFEKLPLPVTLHSSKNGDIVLSFDIPQPEEKYSSFYQFNKNKPKVTCNMFAPESMIFRNREE